MPAALWLNRASLWIQIAIAAVAVIVFIAAAVATKGAAIPFMLKAMAKGAVSGLVIGAIGAMAVAENGGGVGDVLATLAGGVLTGAAMAVIGAGVASIKTAVGKKLANAAKANFVGPIQQHMPATQTMAVQPKTQVIGLDKQHGVDLHWEEINRQVTEMVNSGEYRQIFVNRQLKTAGLVGTKRPDIIGIKWDGGSIVSEIASPSQLKMSKKGKALASKVALMQANNPTTLFNPVKWLFG